MKILFCVLCLSYGGAEKNLCIVANELADRGHEVSICNLNYLPTVQTLNEKVKVFNAPNYTIKGVKRLQQFEYIRKICKQEKPDVLVSFLHIPNFLCPFVGKVTGIPTVICERGDPNRRKGWMQNCYNLADYAVFQTEGAKEYYGKKLQEHSVVVPNPVILNTDGIRVNYERCNSISFAARFSIEQKRQDLMIEAFQIVHERSPKYKLNFYGDGPDEESMKKYAVELGLEESVIFHGRSDNILWDISKSDVFVMSSDYEGIPNALIEAMSIGLPCVSTDCSPGGARMLIENGKNGLIVECNDKEALANAISKMIEDREFAKECGLAATQIKSKYRLPVIIDSWENFLEEVRKNGKNSG